MKFLGLGFKCAGRQYPLHPNIAEGCGRETDKQTLHFLSISQGSAAELEAEVILAQDIEFLSKNQAEETLGKINEAQKMIRGFKASLSQ